MKLNLDLRDLNLMVATLEMRLDRYNADVQALNNAGQHGTPGYDALVAERARLNRVLVQVAQARVEARKAVEADPPLVFAPNCS